MNLPENYIVICETQEETNEVIDFIELDNTKTWQFWNYVTVSKDEWNIYSGKERAEQWFDKHKNISDYKTFTFKEWKEIKKNKTIPKKWVILATEENLKEISDFFVKHTNNNSCYKEDSWVNWYFHSHCNADISIYNYKNFSYCSSNKREGFEEISIEQFREHVLKQKMYSIKELETNKELVVYIDSEEDFFKIKKLTNKFDNFYKFEGNHCYGLYHKSYDSLSTKTYIGQYVKYGDVKVITTNQIIELQNFKENKMKLIVSVKEVLEIHKIACLTWKPKIADYLVRVDSNQNITFTQLEVDEMFKAATSEQKLVLTKIFGEPVKPIEWDRIKTGSKVMIKYLGQHCEGKENINFDKPVTVVFYRTNFYVKKDKTFAFNVNSNYKYCTFYQDGNYILYGADLKPNYITEVIEY